MKVLDEQIVACRALWSTPGVTITLDGVDHGPMWCEPRPVDGDIPVWFGGGPNARTARRVTAWGVGWLPVAGMPDEQVRAGIDRIRRSFEHADRDPATLQVRAGLRVAMTEGGDLDVNATRAAAEMAGEMGVTAVSVTLGRQVDSLQSASEFVSALGGGWSR